MTDTSTDAPAQHTQAGATTPRDRRLRSLFCRFHAVGTVQRTPAYHRSRHNVPTASLSLLTDDDRELDLLVFDKDEHRLRRRLSGLQLGARAYAEGDVQAPHVGQRELPQFIATLIFHTASNGSGSPVIPPHEASESDSIPFA
jgi:hypothetical protein